MNTKRGDKNSINIYQKRIKPNHFWGILVRTVFILFFIVVAIGIILYARGYRFDAANNQLTSTGILAISSVPRSAKVFINGEFRGATDLDLSLSPGTYTVEVKKDGYVPYTKKLTLKGEIVEVVDPILFPINPSLSPLTNLGISKAVQIDSTNRILLFTYQNNPEQDGIYVFEANQTPINIFPPLKLLSLKSSIPLDIDFSKVEVVFSHDYKQAIFSVSQDAVDYSYLISLDQTDQVPLNVSESKQALLSAWELERIEELEKIVGAYPKEIRKVASDSFAMITHSPDQTKVLYRAKKSVFLPIVINPPLIASNQSQETRNLEENHIYVYDRKEDKNFKIGDEKLDIDAIRWYSDSKRLVFHEGNQITMTLYDGTTKQTLYSGPITQNFFAITTGGHLLILSNFNPLQNLLPDVYRVGIR